MTRRSQARARALAVGAVLGIGSVLALGASAGAVTDLTDGGLWYYTSTHMDEVHQRTTGEGITIAVLDTPINPDLATLQGTALQTEPDITCPDGTVVASTTTEDIAKHASGMVEIIIGNGADIGGRPGPRGIAPDATVLHFAVNNGADTVICERSPRDAEAIRAAVAEGADLINMSYSGTFSEDMASAIAEAYRAGVVVVTAAPNYGTGMNWPALANGVITVEEADASQNMDDPVVDPLLTVVAPGSDFLSTGFADGAWDQTTLTYGTSNATAFTSAALALVWSAYPDATANQLIQTLIRNTGTSDHELGRDNRLGYGFVSVPHMLEHDPAEYPDVNPLLRDGEDVSPPLAEVTGDAGQGSQPSADATGTAPVDEVSPSPVALLPFIAAGLAVIGTVVAVIVASTRKNRRQQANGPPPNQHHQGM